MLEDLETAEGATIAEHEKVSGLNYQPTELLWCHEVRKHLRFPYVIYWDHMHCLTASGGVAGYIVNQMVLRFCAALKMELAEWDDFHMKLEGIPRLRKDFFMTRIVNDARAHMRGFAADCLSAMTVIGLFILMVVLPQKFTAMNREIKCFSHMFIILQILRRGNPADLPRLKQEIRLHHLLFIMVFPQCVKPKLQLSISRSAGKRGDVC